MSTPPDLLTPRGSTTMGVFAAAICSVAACHCGGALADYIVGPLENGKEYDASEKCAVLHVMAGYRSRKRQNAVAQRHGEENP